MNHYGSRGEGEGADLSGPTTNKINKFKNKIWLTKAYTSPSPNSLINKKGYILCPPKLTSCSVAAPTRGWTDGWTAGDLKQNKILHKLSYTIYILGRKYILIHRIHLQTPIPGINSKV